MPSPRRQVRILAMQALCQWDVQQDESGEALRDLLATREEAPELTQRASSLVTAFWSQRREVDSRISRASRQWELSRISTVERNVLRIAVVELLAGGVPPKVVMNEAIEIGREYGGRDSPRFINGVLDEVWSGLEQPPKLDD